MGAEKIGPRPKPRTVLDTNVLVSALLFYGQPSRLVPLWQQDEIVFLISRDVLNEYLHVLAYPKFRLTDTEIKALVDSEVLPFTEPVRVQTRLRAVAEDPSDDKFLELAVEGKADFIISSDKHLLRLSPYTRIEIIPVAGFLERMDRLK
jgi:putative PIN family toxin of toxin-antitoxin system